MIHLVVGDPHAKPGVSNRRFTWLGKLILDLKPDVVINMGDLADMESLCTYDRGTKGFEGRRYKADIDAANEALDRIRRPIRKAKKKYPRLVYLEGNHEHRIHRAIECDAILDGTIGLNDIQWKENLWEMVPYRGSSPGIIEIDGIAYAHFFTSGVMGRPISGENPARSMLMKKFMSTTAGHLHTFDYAERNNAAGQRIQSCLAGCFLDPKQEEGYAGFANSMWRRGVVIKRDVCAGRYDFEWVSIERLRKAYG